MNKKVWIIFGALILLVGGGFLIVQSGMFGKKIVRHEVQSVVDLQPETIGAQGDNSVSSENKSSEKEVVAEKPIAKAGDVKSDSTKISSELVSWGFAKSSGRTIRAIIVHTSYNNLGGDPFDFDKVVQEWKDAGVAPHYAIDRAGTIHQLVIDQNIAWHAGVAKLPDGTTNVNGASIGIEIVNNQDSKFSDAEYDALNSLIASLKKKYAIKYVLGHDEIAPGRKTDPWGIDWKKVNR